MGTRNLTVVFIDGKYKISQYGQWDGYPEGQGATILEFLSDSDAVEKLKVNLSKVRYLEPDGKDKQFVEEYDNNAPEWSNEPDNRTPEQKRWWNTYMTRDLGGMILSNIANSQDDEIVLRDNLDFVGSISCEWCYVIDFDKNTFEVYGGYDHTPLDEDDRFYGYPQDSSYPPVKLQKEYNLESLPTMEEFFADFMEEEEA